MEASLLAPWSQSLILFVERNTLRLPLLADLNRLFSSYKNFITKKKEFRWVVNQS